MKANRAGGVIKLCSDRTLSLAQLERAARLARREDPRNVPSVSRIGRTLPGTPPNRPARMALLTSTRWKPGRTLRVAFMGGAAKVRSKIESFAKQWEKHANLQFDFDNGSNAEIRIAFDENDGSWSYLGNQALAIAKSKPTMNYGWLEPDTSDDEYSRVVLHEFGHALGCVHEHEHPAHGIPWDKPKVYEYYKKTDGWTKEEVDEQVFSHYSKSETNFSQFDPKSIMLYAIPDELTIGSYSVGWNKALSSNDKQFIATMYPGTIPAPTELTVDGPALKAAIGSRGEEDTYTFRVPKTGRFEVKTDGKTDLVLMLLGPDSETRVVAEDDDSGYGRNPRIREVLIPGTYHVRARHYSKKGTGKYEIKVRSLKL
jgi:hypothetical protein